jgi:hypothetical protein
MMGAERSRSVVTDGGEFFRRSSFCSLRGGVEVAENPRGEFSVRSTRNTAVELRPTRQEWADFLAGVKAGEFDMADEDR